MSLSQAPLLYVFYETTSLPLQRKLFEEGLGLPVIENQFHPPHEYHGLVKYDGGQVVLSLNLAQERRFRKDGSDGLVTVLEVANEDAILEQLRHLGYAPTPGELFTDDWGHHYRFQAQTTEQEGVPQGPVIRALHLTVEDLNAALDFYSDILGLTLLERTVLTARFATGTIDLVLQESDVAADDRPVLHHTYLLVFYTADIYEAKEALIQRGISRAPLVGTSDIGRTARFLDPSGHVYCLYEPSEESLTWGSGPKVMEIVEQGYAPSFS